MKLATMTRNQAYSEILDKIGEAQLKVYEILKQRKDMTNREIAQALGWEINRVTGRVFELREIGLVLPSVKRMCGVGRRVVQAWMVTPVSDQVPLNFG